MAATTSVAAFTKHFRKLKDPRVVKRSRHLLLDVIVIAVCGVIANCDDWPDIELFAKERRAWFGRFLRLPEGIPAHDTMERIFARLEPRAFSQALVAWLHEASELLGLTHIAIDGKSARGSASATMRPLHLVSAWATEANLFLGEVAVDGKSNEITAIPQLLALLDLKGALVTIDAIGCQKAIAAQIIAAGGDYVLAVKGNQERLWQDIAVTVTNALEARLDGNESTQVTVLTTTDSGHGRQERRTYTIIRDLSGIRDRDQWAGLTTVGMCCRERKINGKTTEECHYFIGSGRFGARRYAQALRKHWGIENGLHWHLDISFGEDDSRIEDRHSAENFALLRKLALCLLKRHPAKDSIARKRKRAALDPAFLAETITGAAKVEKI